MQEGALIGCAREQHQGNIPKPHQPTRATNTSLSHATFREVGPGGFVRAVPPSVMGGRNEHELGTQKSEWLNTPESLEWFG